MPARSAADSDETSKPVVLIRLGGVRQCLFTGNWLLGGIFEAVVIVFRRPGCAVHLSGGWIGAGAGVVLVVIIVQIRINGTAIRAVAAATGRRPAFF